MSTNCILIILSLSGGDFF